MTETWKFIAPPLETSNYRINVASINTYNIGVNSFPVWVKAVLSMYTILQILLTIKNIKLLSKFLKSPLFKFSTMSPNALWVISLCYISPISSFYIFLWNLINISNGGHKMGSFGCLFDDSVTALALFSSLLFHLGLILERYYIIIKETRFSTGFTKLAIGVSVVVVFVVSIVPIFTSNGNLGSFSLGSLHSFCDLRGSESSQSVFIWNITYIVCLGLLTLFLAFTYYGMTQKVNLIGEGTNSSLNFNRFPISERRILRQGVSLSIAFILGFIPSISLVIYEIIADSSAALPFEIFATIVLGVSFGLNCLIVEYFEQEKQKEIISSSNDSQKTSVNGSASGASSTRNSKINRLSSVMSWGDRNRGNSINSPEMGTLTNGIPRSLIMQTADSSGRASPVSLIDNGNFSLEELSKKAYDRLSMNSLQRTSSNEGKTLSRSQKRISQMSRTEGDENFERGGSSRDGGGSSSSSGGEGSAGGNNSPLREVETIAFVEDGKTSPLREDVDVDKISIVSVSSVRGRNGSINSGNSLPWISEY